MQKKTKKHKVERLAQHIQGKTGISKGKASDIADAVVRNRNVEALSLQKSWPVNRLGDIQGPLGSLSFDEIALFLT